jgi:hypothetical protein
MPSVAKNERKVAMLSIAEIGEYIFGIGFELVAQQQQIFWIWFALELGEFLELEKDVAAIDTGRHHCLDNH